MYIDINGINYQNRRRRRRRRRTSNRGQQPHHSGYEHTVNSHINRLRAKIEQDATSPQIVQTVWGVGYKFNPQGVELVKI